MHDIIRKYSGSRGVVDEARDKLGHLDRRGADGALAQVELQGAHSQFGRGQAVDEAMGHSRRVIRGTGWIGHVCLRATVASRCDVDQVPRVHPGTT
jgi:hypothetical protein